MRNARFFSLAELNVAIRILVDELDARPDAQIRFVRILERLEFVRPVRGGRRVSVDAEAHQIVPDRASAQHNALKFVAQAFVLRQDLCDQQVAIFGDSLMRHFAAA